VQSQRSRRQLLNYQVLPYFAQQDVALLRILNDRGYAQDIRGRFMNTGLIIGQQAMRPIRRSLTRVNCRAGWNRAEHSDRLMC
jgi:hypothetical protein